MGRIPRAASALVQTPLVAVLTHDADGSTSKIWFVSFARERWWGNPARVRRAGIWIRDTEGATFEESWDVSQAIEDAMRRSSERFDQLTRRQVGAGLRLEVHQADDVVAAGVPRNARGGIARILLEDATARARRPSFAKALAALTAWSTDAVVGGAPCDACRHGNVVEAVIELGPDDASDERTLKLEACAACGRRTLVLEEESRRGAGEAVRRRPLDAGSTSAAIVGWIRQCPARRDPRCECPAHAAARSIT